jgi:hypothetical protein
MRSLEGFKVILESLQVEEADVIEDICLLMKEEMRDLTSREKKLFSSKVVKFLQDKKVRKSRLTLSAAINILGYIACPDSQQTLMSFTTLQNHPYIRSQALKALKNLPHHQPTQVEVIKKLVSFLDENDFTNIVSPTMDILMGIPFQTRMADLVIRLLSNPHETVRRFAIKKMRELNSPKVVKVLIDNLSTRDTCIRDLAAESLCWLDSARTILLDRIIQEKDMDLCAIYAKILRPHATKFRANQIKRLTDHLNKLMDEDSPLQEPFIFLLRTAAPDYYRENLLNRSKRFKQRKKFDQAIKALKILQKDTTLCEEALYEMAICQLKVSPKKRNRSARISDPSIPLFQRLIQNENFPLLERLKRDKALDRDDFFYLGECFREKLQKEREFGNALLKMLVKKYPRTKVGSASRKLLKEAEL